MVDLNEEEMIEWVCEPLTPDEIKNAGHYTMEEMKVRFKEIPDELKLTAMYIIETYNYLKGAMLSCREFRCALFLIYMKCQEKGIKLIIPSYWFVDGPMIEPEKIVRITNGIIGWSGDDSCKECGRNDCPYYKEVK